MRAKLGKSNCEVISNDFVGLGIFDCRLGTRYFLEKGQIFGPKLSVRYLSVRN